MEKKMQGFEPLFAIAEELSTSSTELLRLKAVQKSAMLGSTIVTRLILGALLLLILSSLSVALSLYLGELLGKTYLGFLSTAAAFTMITFIVLLLKTSIESGLNNSIIRHFLKN